MSEGLFYIVVGVALLSIFPLHYVYKHYIAPEYHTMFVGREYHSHNTLLFFNKAAYGIAFTASLMIAMALVAYGMHLMTREHLSQQTKVYNIPGQ
jgi:hypothetical protein